MTTATTTTEAPRASRKTTMNKEKRERATPRPTVQLTHPVHRVRLKNLEELIKHRFGGNATQLAKAIGKSHTYLWQLLHLERRIGEMTARHIEEKLELDAGQLDRSTTGKKETTMVLIQHMADWRTRSYRLVPKATLEDFDAKPSARPQDLRPCPLGDDDDPESMRCSDDTVWIKYTSEWGPRLMNGVGVFVDRGETTLWNHALYLVRPLKGPLKGRALLREARIGEAGFVLRSLDNAEAGDDAAPIPERHVKVLGRAIGMYGRIER